jgi:hypothetical protein
MLVSFALFSFVNGVPVDVHKRFAYHRVMKWMGDVQRQDNKQRYIFVAGGVLIIVLALFAGIMFWKYNDTKKNDGEAKSKHVVTLVSEHYLLPTNETPTVAAIQDLDKLKGQAFFEDAKNGDYVLIYSKAKLALLYREADDKLVNVGPVNIDADAAGQTKTGTQ